MTVREFGYQRKQVDELPAGFPNAEDVFILRDILGSDGGPFLRLIECGGLHYGLLLEFNHKVADCVENALLQELYEALKGVDRRPMYQAADKCGKLFWPFVMDDYQPRLESGVTTDAIDPLALTKSISYKIQLRTIGGKLQATKRDTELQAGGGWFEKPFADILSVHRSEVEFVEKITNRIFKVKLEGKQYCAKTSFSDTEHLVLREIKKLHRIPNHPNVIHLSCVLDNGDGKTYGMLMPFFSGGTLSDVQSATESQKSQWKERISKAVHFLHRLGVVWGDAKPDNIVMNPANDNPVLIDFEGGSDDAWIDRHLADTKDGDMQTLERIFHYIDRIPTS